MADVVYQALPFGGKSSKGQNAVGCARQMKAQLPWRTRFAKPVHLVNQAYDQMHLEEKQADDQGTEMHSSVLPALIRQWRSWQTRITSAMIFEENELEDHEKNIAGTLHRFLLAIDSLFHTVSEIPCLDCLLSHEVRFEMILGMNGEVLWLGKDEKLDSYHNSLFRTICVLAGEACPRWRISQEAIRAHISDNRGICLLHRGMEIRRFS
ncbi:hypothetical protein GOP47_0010114 [Adiantum capillus-veneris]|uniref:Uncharacterized protein n=1 Tax=Adiantum capillus-veneris TaxID=13818 RepID=A0A9D4ZG14_ADICA|nr:hypothetical protein GOP47_0010114 [Adiantum capillus-veneris]